MNFPAIPRDKLIYAAGGLIAALGCGALAWVLLKVGLSPLAVAILIAGVATALSAEAAQWSANRSARALNLPTRHEVSVMDALASFAPAAVIAAVIEIGFRSFA